MDMDRPLHEEWKKRVCTHRLYYSSKRNNPGSPTNILHFRVLNVYAATWVNESKCIFCAVNARQNVSACRCFSAFDLHV